MATFTVTLTQRPRWNDPDPRPPKAIKAHYYKLENNWFSFKDERHNTLVDIDESSVEMIERTES